LALKQDIASDKSVSCRQFKNNDAFFKRLSQTRLEFTIKHLEPN